MQLLQAKINNFRSLRDVSIDFEAHTALIGGNGAGKSSILKALERFYSTSKTLDQDDYFGRDITCRLPVNLIQAFLEVSGQTSPKETTDAQEQIHRESDRYDVEAG